MGITEDFGYNPTYGSSGDNGSVTQRRLRREGVPVGVLSHGTVPQNLGLWCTVREEKVPERNWEEPESIGYHPVRRRNYGSGEHQVWTSSFGVCLRGG